MQKFIQNPFPPLNPPTKQTHKPKKIIKSTWKKQTQKFKINKQQPETTKPNQISSSPLFTLIHFSFFSLDHSPKSNLSLSLSLWWDPNSQSIRKCCLQTTNRWWWTPGQEESTSTSTNQRRRRTMLSSSSSESKSLRPPRIPYKASISMATLSRANRTPRRGLDGVGPRRRQRSQVRRSSARSQGRARPRTRPSGSGGIGGRVIWGGWSERASSAVSERG